MKPFAMCFVFAVVAEALIYRGATRDYSPLILAVLAVVWGFGSLILAWFEPRLRFAYLGSVALSTPAISYSMLGYGVLEMAGLIHAFCAGAYAIPAHVIIQRFKARNRVAPEPQ